MIDTLHAEAGSPVPSRAADALSDDCFFQRLAEWETRRVTAFRALGEQLRAAAVVSEAALAAWPNAERHPLFHSLMDLVEGQFERPLATDFHAALQRAVARLATIPAGWAERGFHRPRVEQNPALLPSDGYALSRIDLLPAAEQTDLQGELERVADCLEAVDAAIARYVFAILRVATFIRVDRDGDYFSGSASEFYGAAHFSANFQPDALGEMFVHEGEHARLHLLEREELFFPAGVDERHVYYSPWRPDPRPLYGIFHGVHVFGGVLHFLIRFLERGPAERQVAARRRLNLLAAQQRRGLDELAAHARLSPLGEAVVRQARQRLAEADELLTEAERRHAGDAVTRAELERKAAWPH
jgi:hypothetical protein